MIGGWGNFMTGAPPNINIMIKSKRMSWTGGATRMEEKWNTYRLLVGMSEGNRPLGRPRRR
jgi:hypothetical protein